MQQKKKIKIPFFVCFKKTKIHTNKRQSNKTKTQHKFPKFEKNLYSQNNPKIVGCNIIKKVLQNQKKYLSQKLNKKK